MLGFIIIEESADKALEVYFQMKEALKN